MLLLRVNIPCSVWATFGPLKCLSMPNSFASFFPSDSFFSLSSPLTICNQHLLWELRFLPLVVWSHMLCLNPVPFIAILNLPNLAFGNDFRPYRAFFYLANFILCERTIDYGWWINIEFFFNTPYKKSILCIILLHESSKIRLES